MPEARRASRPAVRGLTVAHVLPWDLVGGVEQATLRLGHALDRAGHRNLAFCTGRETPVGELFAGAGIRVFEYDGVEPSYRRPARFLRATLALARELRRQRVDVVHCSDLLAGYFAGIAGRLAGAHVVCHVRGQFDDISPRDRTFLRWIHRFVFVSRHTWKHFGYPVAPERATVLYDGVDVPSLEGAARDARSVREEFGIPERARIVGMVARVAPGKDYETLIRAATRVVQAGEEVRFLIVGDHSRSAIHRERHRGLLEVLEAARLRDHFVFTDFRTDIPRLTRAMDISVLSSHSEGFPLVILEAMAQGKPVIATDVGGVSEVVADGQTGFLTEPGNDAQLADRLLDLLRDPDGAGRLGSAARELIRRDFSDQRYAASVAHLYGGLAPS